MGMGNNTAYEAVYRRSIPGMQTWTISQGHVKRCEDCGEWLEEGDTCYREDVGRRHIYRCLDCAAKIAEQRGVESALLPDKEIPF